MSQFKFRTRVTTTAAALTLLPALALAEGGSAEGSQTGANPSGQTSASPSQEVSPSPEPAPQRQSGTRMDEMDPTGVNASDGAPADQSQRQSAQAQGQSAQQQQQQQQASIDPAQVQRVFGTDVTLVDLKSLGAEQVKQLQQALQERGHYQGEIDGIVGPKTRAGLTALLAQQYSLTQRLVNQGQITDQLASSIGLSAAGRTPVSGVDMQQNDMQQPRTNPSTPSTRSYPQSGQPPAQPSPPSPGLDPVEPTDDSMMEDDIEMDEPEAPR